MQELHLRIRLMAITRILTKSDNLIDFVYMLIENICLTGVYDLCIFVSDKNESLIF